MGELIHGLTYTMDYCHVTDHTLQHLWSLSVEEQFYLLWPITLLLLRPSKSRAVCWFLILACPLLRAWGWYFSAINHDDLFRRFEMVADALAIGALLAIYKDRLPKWTTSSLISLFCFGLILLDCMIVPKFNAFPIVGITLNSVCSALIICGLTSQGTAISRFLSWSPLAWLGTISYSIYLWQQLFLSPPAHPLLKLVGVLGAATMSYYFIERPIRDWGRHITSRPKAPVLELKEASAASS